MEIKQTAIAGTVESSDIQITISKGEQGNYIELESSVYKLYADQIKKVISETLQAYGINNARVKAVDKGALDCVIKARTITAIQRALDISDEPNWEVL